ALATELVDAAVEAGHIERAIEGYQYRLESSIELGDLVSAHADLDEMTRLAEELRQPAQKWLVGLVRTHVALLEGGFAEAEQLIDETRSLGERVQEWEATMYYGLQLYVLRRELGRIGELDEFVRHAVTDNPTYPIWRCVLANMLAELGATADARGELEALATDDFSGLPFDEEWEVSICLLAETPPCLGDSERAEALYDLLLPSGDRVAVSYPEISLGPVSHFLGILATTSARLGDAEGHFSDALELNERIGARPWLAHTREDYGRMLLDRGGPGDVEKAQVL